MKLADKVTAVLAAGAALGAMLLADPPKAKADAISGCEDMIWLMPFQSTRRAICDGERRADGSWLRVRVHYTPEYYKPARTSCYGSYYVSCTTTGGYWVDYNEFSKDSYLVNDGNVLPTEPGHLENSLRV